MDNASPGGEDAKALGAILSVLHENTGVDFAEYRRPTIFRRIRNRMMSVGAATLPEYLSMVRASGEEAAALLDRVTIKVSRFYRNAAVFDRIRGEVLPSLAAAAGARPLRIWSAGCGRGEEAYTLAMLMEEEAIAGHVIASDIDRKALADAEAGIYPSTSAQELPARLLERYLEPVSGKASQLRVAPVLRDRVSFRIEDLTRRASPDDERFDLVCCRNVLIYLAQPAQQRALERLVGAISHGGYLMLGEAEWPSARALAALGVVCSRQRIFRAHPGERIAA